MMDLRPKQGHLDSCNRSTHSINEKATFHLSQSARVDVCVCAEDASPDTNMKALWNVQESAGSKV